MTKITLSRAVFLLAVILSPTVKLTPQTPPAQSARIPQFENDDVNVWKTTVLPNAPVAMHTHEHPRVIVALTSGTMKIQYESGKSEEHQWEAGKAYWLSSEEGKQWHSDVNVSARPIEVMVVEVKNAK